MIRSNQYIGPAYTTLQSTYNREEWNTNRMNYIQEARTDARAQAPCKVLLRVKDSPRQRAVIVATIIASPPG